MTERELERGAARRLAIIRHAQEVTGNVSLTCRYYGITRQAYYTWLRRYEAQGLEGLRDRSRRPRVSPNATKGEVVGKIVYLRRSYHFGLTQEALPVHGDRRLHQNPGPSHLRPTQPAQRDPVPGLRAREAPVPGRGDPD